MSDTSKSAHGRWEMPDEFWVSLQNADWAYSLYQQVVAAATESAHEAYQHPTETNIARAMAAERKAEISKAEYGSYMAEFFTIVKRMQDAGYGAEAGEETP